MKRVLYIASVDFNKYGGGAQAVRAFLDSTLDIFGADRVDVMAGNDYIFRDEYKNINYILVQKRSRLYGYYEVLKGYMERWTKAIYNHLRANHTKYELIIINSSRSGVIIPQLKKFGLKVITIHHNDEVEYCMDNKNMYTFGGRFSLLINRAQRMAYKYSDVNVFLTNQDCCSFKDKYGGNNGINTVLGVYDYKSAKVIVPDNVTPLYDIGISGSLGDYQTIHGIMSLKKNYHKITQELIPNLKLLITGRNPSKEILDFAKEYPRNITVIPSPIDIHNVLQPCMIYLCPTDIGGGLKLRVMDGLKLGKPILVHKVSARGYDMFVNKPYFKIYHDIESFRHGLEDIVKYISETDNNDYQRHISSDYYSFFGYSAGTQRFRNIINNLG